MKFLEALAERVLVIDGATGTMVQNLDLSDADFGGAEFKMLADLLVFSRPQDQVDIHLAYFRAGALGYEDFSYHLSKRAASLGVQAIETYQAEGDYDGRDLFVLGSIGPSNWVLSCTRADLRRGTFDQISDNFFHQARGLIDGGADVCLIETQQDILEVKAAVHGCRRAFEETGKQVPIVAQVTVDEFARMQIFDTDIHAALTTVAGVGIDVFGINCSIGPDLMEKAIETMARYSPLPLSVIPNAGLPESIGGETVFPLEPEPFTEILVDLVEKYDIAMVGGCCGTRPAHIEALTKAMAGRVPGARQPDAGLFVSGPQKAVELDSSRTLIKIGERLNVRGSRKVRKAVESDGPTDFDGLRDVVDQQVRDLGLDVIDVCMDSNLVDTSETLTQVIYEMTDDFPAAMCLDSFEVEALDVACKTYPGRPIVNSFSLEEYRPGVDKVDAVCEVTRFHDPLYIALCTGPDGPAATRREKVELARAICDKAHQKWGVPYENILVDVNVFPVGSEADESMNFALETLEGVALVKKEIPGVHTTLGVGNLTMGLGKKPYMRKVLLSVFMEEARQRGLDAAIINPEHYVFPEDLPHGDYELGQKVILERDMDAFAQLEDIADTRTARRAASTSRAGATSTSTPSSRWWPRTSPSTSPSSSSTST
jgi:5-methyltetrahydrofolate--homocysteine methyltransferase